MRVRTENQRHDEAKYRIKFIRKLRNFFRGKASKYKNQQDLYPKLYSLHKKYPSFLNDKLLECVLDSMLAKFVLSGNCWEHAAVGLTEFFSPDFKGRAELLQLKSKQDVNSHCILVLNRDPKTNLNDPEKWNKESIILDGWKKRMLDFNKESVSMLEIDDLNGKKEDLYFESHIVIDQPLSLVDIDKIIVLLGKRQRMCII